MDEKLCGRIVLLRHRLNLSQRAFAERIGRSVGYVNRIENGKNVPTSAFLQSVSDAFGVDISWLMTGNGSLAVESVGDRIKQARKARDYTQEELAGEIGVSRNSVGMIERGTFRPGEVVIDSLCDCLWIDKNWLMTGVGHMERMELTPFYDLLRRDPDVRRHIRSYIDHLDRPREEEKEEREAREERWAAAYVVHDAKQARQFFEHYNIEYREAQDEAGKIVISVRAPGELDQERAHQLQNRLRRIGLTHMCDHEFVWRDRDGDTLVTYSPYDVEEVRQTWIEKVDNNFYGFGTTTYLVRT